MDLKSHIKGRSQELLSEITGIRRHIHANPELSYQERETAAFVAHHLSDTGIEFREGLADTGLVGLIKGQNPEKKISALRADMDALPILEKTTVDYKSTKDGVMHACGHDVHTSSLIGAAKILYETRDKWEGTVKLIFQPGEEQLPGGASLMIKDGALENPKPTSIVGQHVFPELPAGKVGFKPGIYMASADEIYITITGRGGHGAMPHKNVDSVLIASHLVVALQQIVSRQANPGVPSVLSFGRIEGLGATNVIPSEVKLAGTFRTFDEKWRYEAHDRITKLATSLAESMGGKAEVHIPTGYPFLINDEALTLKSMDAARAYMGAENVIDLDVRMTGEDFSYYTHHMPGCFYRLGTASTDGSNAFPVHHPEFNIDEEALVTGMGLMAYLGVMV